MPPHHLETFGEPVDLARILRAHKLGRVAPLLSITFHLLCSHDPEIDSADYPMNWREMLPEDYWPTGLTNLEIDFGTLQSEEKGDVYSAYMVLDAALMHDGQAIASALVAHQHLVITLVGLETGSGITTLDASAAIHGAPWPLDTDTPAGEKRDCRQVFERRWDKAWENVEKSKGAAAVQEAKTRLKVVRRDQRTYTPYRWARQWAESLDCYARMHIFD